MAKAANAEPDAWLHRLAFAFMFCAAGHACSAASQVEPWGATQDGTKIERVTLQNDRGMRLSYIDYGATITSVEVPDRQGKLQNVMLSLPDLASYERTKRRFAAIMGRYAGRIGNARFTLGDRTIALVPRANGVAMHGDPNGYDRRIWSRKDFSDSTSIGSVFHLISPDGDQNFPGRLDVSVTYRLFRKSNEFRIEYAAKTDAPTVLNLTNHGYFNLAGAGSTGLGTHTFQIMADRFAETDAKRVPTGVILSVAGTPLDFQKPSSMTERLAAAPALLGNPAGFDHSLLFSRSTHQLALVAVIDETLSGRRMQVLTTEPSVQLNSGNGFDGSEIGSEGLGYQRYDGFAFETQHLPDSPNHPGFPSTILVPGKVFRSVTGFRFSIVPRGL
ncbi:aldose epimerase family protein [Undibacterium sp.]|uniref:aldose epimerase family protein n=1 Tax=Undibacterium sp. TaxID=1914977 RepID=UPI002D10CE59|nr:aldose epimerase family protein [Undibacterium sp.]HTD03402.1 aldose epimerase family protein [Undibacterium sp.]